MSQYHKLYTPEDSAVVFIDHQPQMTFGVASIGRASLINNVTLLAKVANELSVKHRIVLTDKNPQAAI
jgi:nicotinamidase-related amidase